MPPNLLFGDIDWEEPWTWDTDPVSTHTRIHIPANIANPVSEASQLSRDDIEIGGTLCAGNFGVFFKGVIKSTQLPVAIKQQSINTSVERERFLIDIRMLVQAEVRPNLVQLYGCLVNKQTVALVMEYMDLGSLADLSKRISQHGDKGVPANVLASITGQIIAGVEQVHSKKVLHTNIKPDNVLLNTSGVVKLTDFRMMSFPSDSHMGHCRISSPIYMSPERCLGEEFSFASDIWETGLIIYELACGHYPFWKAHSFPALFEQIVEKPEPRLDEAEFSPELCDFIACCLTRDVLMRSDTVALCTHPFVKSEPVEILNAHIAFQSANDGLQISCCDLGGTERVQFTLGVDADIKTLESWLRNNVQGFKQLVGEDGPIVNPQQLVKTCMPVLAFTVSNAALARYLECVFHA